MNEVSPATTMLIGGRGARVVVVGGDVVVTCGAGAVVAGATDAGGLAVGGGVDGGDAVPSAPRAHPVRARTSTTTDYGPTHPVRLGGC